jgi:hypothetical protein
VEASAVYDRVKVRLEGIVRHATVTSEGAVRVGVEFDDNEESESYRITTEGITTPR